MNRPRSFAAAQFLEDSPILMERIVARFRPSDNVQRGLIEAGASEDLLASLVLVTPGENLETYRFSYVGRRIEERIGREITGHMFQRLLEYSESFRHCLQEFRQAHLQEQKIVSRHRFDFSDRWMIEYSRIIYPLVADAGNHRLVAHYVFHEVDQESRYF